MDKSTQELKAALMAWREAHPEATLLEMEDLVDGALGKVRAELLSDLASAGRQAEGRMADGKLAVCPKCQGASRDKGKAMRSLKGPHNERVVLTRRRLQCKHCGGSFFST